MVETQHSINNILSFGAKSVNPKILEKLLVGRENTVNYLYESVEAIVTHKSNQFILIVGQRGMGKTHLMRVLHHRIQHYIKANKIVVAYFSEEEYGVANYFDFLIRILNAFMKWNEKDTDFLQSKIEELQETIKQNWESHAEIIIEEYIAKRPLLILTENFADILEAIKPKEQAKLRAWLYKVNNISIIATSQAISEDFQREDRPFYGTFNEYYLKKLSYKDTLNFLTLLAKTDKRDDVIDFMQNKGKGQIKALHRLVKGNHRLLVTFYQFLKTNTLASLSENFIKTINDLKPYYETYIRNLPAQQQKVLRYIALNRNPQLGVTISKNCFIDQKSLTKQLSELNRRGLIEVITNPNDKRNKLYDINEPLLRISIEVGEHKEGITAIFIDFLAIYYNENELSSKKENFSMQLKKCKSLYEKTQFIYEIQAIDKAIKLKEKEYGYLDKNNNNEVIKAYFKSDINKSEVVLYELLLSKKLIEKEEDFIFLLGQYYYLNSQFDKLLIQVEKFKKINSKDYFVLFAFSSFCFGLYFILTDLKWYKLCFELIAQSFKINPNSKFSVHADTYLVQLIFIKKPKIQISDILVVLQVFSKYRIINEFNRVILNQSLIYLLNFSRKLTKPQLNTLLKIAKKHQKKHKEFIITENYINIYKQYVLENNKKAIYDLPKEQRLFFEEHILNKQIE